MVRKVLPISLRAGEDHHLSLKVVFGLKTRRSGTLKSIFFPSLLWQRLTANQLQRGAKKSFPTWQSADTFTQLLFMPRVRI